MEKGWHYHWHYLRSGFYADQVSAYMENFSRVKVCFLEDMHNDAGTFVRDIFRFLEVDETFEPQCIDAIQRGWCSPLEAALQPGPQGATGPGRKCCNLAGRLFGEERLLRWRETMRTRLLVREPLRAQDAGRVDPRIPPGRAEVAGSARPQSAGLACARR